MSFIINEPVNLQAQRSYKLVGHRGNASMCPENTMVSISSAIKLCVDRIEIDIHMTKDGQIILMHDRTLNRTTNGTGEVRDHTLDEIKQYDAGSWFSPEFAGEKIPTLDEILDLINGKCELLIEVKNHSGYTPGIEDSVAAIIRRHHAESWCFAISLRHKVIKNFHDRAPDIRLMKSYVGKLPLIPVYISNGITLRGLRSYPYVEEFNLNKGFIGHCILKKARKMGKKINAWTDDNPHHAEKLVKRGVDGIITNCPAEIGQQVR
jgi:glycerophosphoryl diester phosphodiesterase